MAVWKNDNREQRFRKDVEKSEPLCVAGDGMENGMAVVEKFTKIHQK
jgi:hypothetical protein